MLIRGDHFQFGSVFIKKSNQSEIFFFKKIKTEPTGFGSVRFFRAKTGSNRFDSVFSVFFGFGSIFSVLARFFFWFFSVSVRFGLVFLVFAYKTETEPSGFFKIFIGLILFFFCSVFSVIFFSDFLGLICFLIFLLTPSVN